MASFKFNFSNTETENSVPDTDDDKEIAWLSAEEIIPTNQINDLDDLASHARMFTCGEVEIGHILVNNVKYSKEIGLKNLIDISEKEQSDLIPGKYEGGLKVWECTYDLIEFFENHPDNFNFNNAKVLDLGCGAGILGIYALLKKALVTFQDYNKEILEHFTIPNVLLNLEEEEREQEIKQCKFYSGDWASFQEALDKSEVFDIILTSETIYNKQNYNKLICLFQNRLSDNGRIFVGSKTYYFGVGGGTRQFEAALETSKLKSKVVNKISSGIQREILEIIKS